MLGALDSTEGKEGGFRLGATTVGAVLEALPVKYVRGYVVIVMRKLVIESRGEREANER